MAFLGLVDDGGIPDGLAGGASQRSAHVIGVILDMLGMLYGWVPC